MRSLASGAGVRRIMWGLGAGRWAKRAVLLLGCVGFVALAHACSLEPRAFPGQSGVVFECTAVEECDDGEPCTKDTCDEHGQCGHENDEGYVPDDGNECTADVCKSGAPTNPPRTDEPCGGKNGAAFCDALGNCAGCDPATTDEDCGPDLYCDGSVCRKKLVDGQLCSHPYACSSGNCVDNVCCAVPCDDAICQSCSAEQTGFPAGQCHLVITGKDPDGDCYDGAGCTAIGTCFKEKDGKPCSTAGECGSGYCVDGVCCTTECKGVCQACNLPDNEGSCLALPAATDPEGECFDFITCSGFSSCNYSKNGEACGNSKECASGQCVDGVCCTNNCTGLCRSCASGACLLIPAGQDPADECAGAMVCNGNGACQ